MTKDHLNLSTDNAQDSLFSIDDCNEAYQYLQNSANFVSFHTGLTTLMQRCGYTGSSEDVEEKTAYLQQKLAAIHVKITEITVRDWFSGKHRPSLDSRSRKLVYEICFALGASFELVQEFFRQVYFSRSFNCHTIKEAVYYYCLHQNHSYNHALELYETIKTMPETAKFEASAPVYTDQIRNALDNCRSDEEFLAYFSRNKSIFDRWNQRALFYIEEFVRQIRGTKEDIGRIEAFGKVGTIPDAKTLATPPASGLTIQEFFMHARHDSDYPWQYSGRNVTSIDFILEFITTFTIGVTKDATLPDIVKLNFPSKKTFSKILNRSQSETSTSYDSIRKCLILLKFYHFWVTLELMVDSGNAAEDPQSDYADYFDDFCEEMAQLLEECGYEELYERNPYDWIFLWASTTEQPLESFRGVIQEIKVKKPKD